MKGISAVIATILLLLIAIAIIGFAFGFFQRIFTGSSAAVENQTGQLTGQLGTSVRIESASGRFILLRNTGTSTIDTTSVAVYLNNAFTSCGWGTNTTITPNQISGCTLAAPCSGQTVRVTTAGVSDSTTCS